MNERIYLSPPDIGPVERDLVTNAFDSNWIAPLGPHVDAFELELAERCGVSAAAALSSGTASLHLALLLAGVATGDEVVCPTLTFVATANPIIYAGASPLFIDCDETTWTLDPDLLETTLESRSRSGNPPKAVIAVDLYGQCADYQALENLCTEYGVALIEDAAEALGASAYGQPAGSFGDYGIMSFNGNKIITTSGGGALLCHDTESADRARFLASQARDPASHYQHSELGYNYRMSNLLAAVGRAQLMSLDQKVRDRRDVFDRYVEGLGDLLGFSFMPEAEYGTSNRWLPVLTISPDMARTDREQVRLALEADNIEARPVWKPMHLQPLYADARMIGGAVSERLFAEGLCLPTGSTLSIADQDRVIGIVRETVTG